MFLGVEMSEENMFASDAADKYVIRFANGEMRDQLKFLAAKSGRKTLAAEINAALLAHINSGGVGYVGGGSKEDVVAASIELSEVVQKKMSVLIAKKLFELQQSSIPSFPSATIAIVYLKDDGAHAVQHMRGIDASCWESAVGSAVYELRKINKEGRKIVSAVLSMHASCPTDPTLTKVFQPKDWTE